MGLGGTLWRELVSLGGLLYRWLLTLFFWVYKVSGKVMLAVYRWWVTMGRRNRLTLLGAHIYGFHRKGMNDWAGRHEIRELLTLIEGADRKRKDLASLSQELDLQYRERIDKVWKQPPPPPAETEEELLPS
ncbi:MAG: hypothetical protein H6Q51_1402 [Deltaproteobacteria bacterium]|nr:hypothetical protein [Deltaproteobacteria bacterium]